MNNIRLYLYDKFGNDATKEYEVELDSSIQFAITKQFTDLENPTTIINDWSKSIAIPFTKHNNEIFNYLYKSDRAVISNEPVGAFGFDPTKKIPFRLINDENVLMTGYVKVLSVEQTSSVEGKYNITLNGELGKIFQELKNITFNRSESGTDYYIDGSEYVFEEMNKELIKTCWTTDGQSTMTLMKRSNPDYKVTDIIGFAPNNAFCEDFDYKSFEDTQHEIRTFSSVLDEKWATDAPNIGVEANSVIPNGLTPRGLGEFRSYQQVPYIYWNKLWKIFQEKVESITGYEFELDTMWFNDLNPYWSKLVYCLDSPKTVTSTNISWDGKLYPREGAIIFSGEIPDMSLHDRDLEPLIPGYTFIGDDLWDRYNNCFNLQQDSYGRDFYCKVQDWTTCTCEFDFEVPYYYEDTFIGMQSSQAFYVDFKIIDTDTNETKQDIIFSLCNDSFETQTLKITDFQTEFTNVDTEHHTAHAKVKYVLPIGLYTKPLYKHFVGERFKISISSRWYDDTKQMFLITTTPQVHPASDVAVTFINDLHIVNNTDFKSFMTFDLNDLWNKEYNILQQVLNYCKVFRIYIEADDSNKKLKFTQSNQYFKTDESDYTIFNWTDKVDYSKPWKLEPNIMESKYLLFNYDTSNETEIEKHYREKYDLNYGEYKYEMDYSFNTETKNMFDKIKLPNVFSPSVISWYTLFALNTVAYNSVDEIYVNNSKEDNKEMSLFGTMFFYEGLKEFQNEESFLRVVQITDDSERQIKLNNYVYNQTESQYIPVPTYPYLGFNLWLSRPDDINRNRVKTSLLFGKPRELYYREEGAILYTDVYYVFWRKYIENLYNIKTKRITCYMRITPNDYENFKFKNFVIIENQIYLVNKIFDYNVNSVESTKVELISINDLDAFTSTEFNTPIIEPFDIFETYSEFVGGTFTHKEWTVRTPNPIVCEWDNTQTTIPNSWTKQITITGNVNDNNREIKVTITPPSVVQTGGQWKYVIKVTANNLETYITGTIQVIRDTDMAQEMTP